MVDLARHRNGPGAGGPGRLVLAATLGSYAAQWDELVLRAPIPSPFLRAAWLSQVPAVQPVFALVVGPEGLRGGVALDRLGGGRISSWRMLGAGPLAPDHLDLVADPRHEAEVVAALKAYWRRPGTRRLALAGLAEDARLLATLPQVTVRSREEVAPYLRLPSADVAAYLSTRPGRLRSSVDRPRKRLMGRQGAWYRQVPRGELDASLGALRTFLGERWGAHAPLLATWPQFAAAATAAAVCGDLQVHTLVAPARAGEPERVVAVDVVFLVAQRLSIYLGGRSASPEWRGAGSLLTFLEIEAAARAGGVREVDFLRGAERYKYDWTDLEREVVAVRSAEGAPAVASLVGGECARVGRAGIGRIVRAMRQGLGRAGC